jgi:hypothetical protein
MRGSITTFVNRQLALRPSQVIEPDKVQAQGQGVGSVTAFLPEMGGFQEPFERGEEKGWSAILID